MKENTECYLLSNIHLKGKTARYTITLVKFLRLIPDTTPQMCEVEFLENEGKVEVGDIKEVEYNWVFESLTKLRERIDKIIKKH